MSDLPADAGVLLMTYGSPDTMEEADVAAYLAKVRGGRTPNAELVTEFARRYRVIGGSPLIEITARQAAALAAHLHRPVRAAMRFSEPTIERALRGLAAEGVRRVVGIVLSPQDSPMLMGGYGRDIEAARDQIGPGAPAVRMAGEWWAEPEFIRALAMRVRAALARLGETERRSVAVLMTAHSLPRHVAEQEPGYLEQLRGTALAVAAAAGLPDDAWQFCWQSAGHEQGEWMQPDLKDLVGDLAATGRSAILVVPVQFLADHLEVLYDIDVGAREQAAVAGIGFARVSSLNDDPALVAALGKVARRTLMPA